MKVGRLLLLGGIGYGIYHYRQQIKDRLSTFIADKFDFQVKDFKVKGYGFTSRELTFEITTSFNNFTQIPIKLSSLDVEIFKQDGEAWTKIAERKSSDVQTTIELASGQQDHQIIFTSPIKASAGSLYSSVTEMLQGKKVTYKLVLTATIPGQEDKPIVNESTITV